MKLPPWLWKVLGHRRTRAAAICAPFALLVIVPVAYFTTNALAARALRKQIAELPARGFEASLDAYLRDHAEADTDLFQHPAMQREIVENRIANKDDPNSLCMRKPKTTRALGQRADLLKMVLPAETDEKYAAVRLLEYDPDADALWLELRTAFARSDAAWPGKGVPAMLKTRSYVDYARIRALAMMAFDDRKSALADLLAVIDLERLMQGSRPTMISIIAARVHQNTVSDLVWEGMQRGFWDDQALQTIEKALRPLDPTGGAVASMRGEIAWMASNPPDKDGPANLKYLKDFGWSGLLTLDRKALAPRLRAIWYCVRPSGCFDYDRVRITEDYISNVQQHSDAAQRRFVLADLLRLRAELEAAPYADFIGKVGTIRLWKENASSYFLAPLVTSSIQAAAQIEVLRVGIALERYRLKYGNHPEALQPLVPEFLSEVPLDPFTEKPLQYRRQPDGSPLVWSIGSDLVDEGGIPNRFTDQGDIVWNTSAISGLTEKVYRR